MVLLDYRDARPIYTQISDTLREQILTGVLAVGDKLPSVRDLATELTINPNTIQRAYRELEAAGWIVSVAGKGSFVSGVPSMDARQLEEKWQELDRLVQNLLSQGISPEEIENRVRKAGNQNA